MGMTIEEAHRILSNGVLNAPSEHAWCMAFIMALETMRKYQKIEEIVNKWNWGIYDDEGLSHTEVMDLVSEVVEDGLHS